MRKNPYAVLNLDETATYDEIKERFRHLAKSIHPDKQSLENYHLAKQHFEEINEAYKAICSPWRRFIFKEFGLSGLKIAQQAIEEFQAFEGDYLTNDQEDNLYHKMAFLINHHHAAMQIQRVKLTSNAVIYGSEYVRSFQKRKVPPILNMEFVYEMPLPELYKFQNMVSVSHISQGIHQLQSRSNTILSINSQRRIDEHHLFILNSTISGKQWEIEPSLQKKISQDTSLTFSMFHFVNFQFQNPKVSLEHSLGAEAAIGVSTDFNSFSFDFMESSRNKKWPKVFRISIDKDSIMAVFRQETDYNKVLNLFYQITHRIDIREQSSETALIYGYRLKWSEALRIELSSTISFWSNVFNITFSGYKYKVTLPISFDSLHSRKNAEILNVELWKLSVMAALLLLFKFSAWLQKKSVSEREKHINAERSRLEDQIHKLNNQRHHIEMTANIIRERETRQQGLVIIACFLGQKDKIYGISRAICNQDHKLPDAIQRYRTKIHDLRAAGQITMNQLTDQVFDLTSIIQMEVLGAQIINFNLTALSQKYNPCIDESEVPLLMVLYSIRGKIKRIFLPSNGFLNIGGLSKHLLKKNWLRNLVNWWF